MYAKVALGVGDTIIDPEFDELCGDGNVFVRHAKFRLAAEVDDAEFRFGIREIRNCLCQVAVRAVFVLGFAAAASGEGSTGRVGAPFVVSVCFSLSR